MNKKIKTEYPGVFFRIVPRPGKPGKTEKSYYVTYKVDGKKIEEACGRQYRDNMTPAKAATYRGERIEGKRKSKREVRAAAEVEKKAKDAAWTINKLWDKYCETFSINKSLKNENLKYEKYIRNGLGKKEPSELIPMDIDRLRMKLQKQGKKTMSARVLELLRRSINFGVKRGLITPLPFKIEIPRLNNQKTEDLSSEQLNKLIQVLNEDEDQTAANIMRIALYSGMRKGEIVSLKWSDIDFRKGFIYLKDPKGGQDQTIPLNKPVIDILESIKKTDDSKYVFPGRFPGEHLTDCRQSIVRIKKAANLPDGFRPLHGLRHVYASMLASSGQVDMYTLQKLLTHKSPQMTQRYAHLRDDTLKRASNLAGTLVNEAISKYAEIKENVINIEKRDK